MILLGVRKVPDRIKPYKRRLRKVHPTKTFIKKKKDTRPTMYKNMNEKKEKAKNNLLPGNIFKTVL